MNAKTQTENDEPVLVREATGFYADPDAWDKSDYPAYALDDSDDAVELSDEGLDQAQEDRDFVNDLLSGDF